MSTKDPGFIFYPGDYLRDTQCLSENSQVSYDRIMCEHMRNICISKKQLKFFTKKLSDDELEELMMVLTEKENGFQITWVAESIVKRRAYSESRRNNRRKKNKEKLETISKTYDEHMEIEIENDNENKEPFGKSENLLELEREFIDSTANYFSQTTTQLKEKFEMYIFSLMNRDMFEEFKRQTEAYIDFKKLTGQQVHRWLGYQAEWQTDDWVHKLQSLQETPVNGKEVPKKKDAAQILKAKYNLK